MQDKSISCSGDGEIIRIDNVFTAYIANAMVCDESPQDEMIPGYTTLECTAWQEYVYFRYPIQLLLLS